MGKKFLILIALMFLTKNSFSADELIKLKRMPIVIGDKINVRKEHNVKSEILYQLRLTDSVNLLKRSGIKYKNGDIDGEWIYIDTEYTKPGASESIKGWIIDSFIADYSKFKKINYSFDCRITGTIGDWRMDYTFLKNGKYKRKDVDYETGVESYKVGNIFQYKQVLIFKDDDSDTYDFFYVKDDKELCHYYRDMDGNSICTKCKSKK